MFLRLVSVDAFLLLCSCLEVSPLGFFREFGSPAPGNFWGGRWLLQVCLWRGWLVPGHPVCHMLPAPWCPGLCGGAARNPPSFTSFSQLLWLQPGESDNKDSWDYLNSFGFTLVPATVLAGDSPFCYLMHSPFNFCYLVLDIHYLYTIETGSLAL